MTESNNNNSTNSSSSRNTGGGRSCRNIRNGSVTPAIFDSGLKRYPPARYRLALILGCCCCCIAFVLNTRPAWIFETPEAKFAKTAETTADPALLDAALAALGCGSDAGDNQQGTDDVSVSAAAAACVERIASDASKKKLARRYHREERARAARKHAAEPSEYGDGTSRAVLVPGVPPSLSDDADSKFAAKNEWRNGSNNSDGNSNATATATATGIAYPNIEIAGFPKTGTSQLYSVLSNRPDTIPFHPSNKEFCSTAYKGGNGSNEQTRRDLFAWHEKVYRDNLGRVKQQQRRRPGAPPLLSVNGCISVEDVVLRHAYLRLKGETTGGGRQQKVVVLFRDPAEWMWSAWNFWTDETTDVRTREGEWTEKSANYRSPELFHEIFSAGPDRTKQFPRRFALFRTLGVRGVQRLWTEFGRENVLLLKSEDMTPGVVNATGGFLDRLSAFTGLDRSLYGDGVFRYSNCNDAKGAGKSCGDRSSAGAYNIAGGRGMLPETRDLVYMYFWEECKIWSKEFGVHYPDCVNVIQDSAEVERTR